MTKFLPVMGILLAGAAVPLAAQPTMTQEYEAVSQPDVVDSTTQATDLRFKRDEYDRMTVPVRVGGSGPYRFLIDTGADRTAISSVIARHLNLRDRKDVILHSVTGISSVETAKVPMLDLTAKTMRNIDAALLEPEHMGADGILGLDSLRSQRVLFDFKNQTLTVVPAETRVKDDKDTIVVTAHVRNGRLILAQARAEGIPVTLVIDTGAQVSIGNEALLRRLNRGSVKRTGPIELHSVTGKTLTGQYTIVKEMTVAEITLKQLPVVFADSHAFRRLGLDKKPALLLGMNALRGFDKVSIDFYRKKLKVVLPEESSLQLRALALR